MKLLQIDSSILGDHSTSRVVTRDIVAHLRAQIPAIEVAYRDVVADPVGHLSQMPPDRDDLLDEFLGADIVVVGAPLYNFSIPSQLKAWIDRLCVAGRTFAYDANGPKGLLGGKRIILAISSGNVYGPGTPAHHLEHAQSYLRAAFGFMGASVQAVVAEGVGRQPDGRDKALGAARAQIASL